MLIYLAFYPFCTIFADSLGKYVMKHYDKEDIFSDDDARRGSEQL